jgi:hypothetical protein
VCVGGCGCLCRMCVCVCVCVGWLVGGWVGVGACVCWGISEYVYGGGGVHMHLQASLMYGLFTTD